MLFALQVQAQIVDSLSLYGRTLDVDVYGNVFVLGTESSLVTVFSPGQQARFREFGGPGWGNDEFDRPSGIWCRNGLDLFVADYGNHRVQRYDRTLTYVSTLYTREDPDPSKRFGYPTDVALSRLGDLFICDSENARILKVTRSTQVDRSFGGYDAGKGRLFSPSQLEIGAKDILYVLDGKRIVVYDTFGNYMREFGSGIFNRPSCIFADRDRIIVLDGDILYHFDADERPAPPVSVPELTDGRLTGGDVSSLVFSGSVLYLMTAHGVFLLKLPARPG
jgi:hypothetical protein